MIRDTRTWAAVLLVVLAGAVSSPEAKDPDPPAMFGNTPARNMVSAEKGLPTKWDPATGLNTKWSQPLGSQSYGGPVVYGGKVFVGTNNELGLDPKYKGDRGNLMAFRASDGQFLWQSAHQKLSQGRVNDWPLQGVCSGPAVEGDRLYYVSNRAELICADTEGFRDGENDGPYTDESEMQPGPEGAKKVVKTQETDEDVVWKLDMIAELDVFPHNLAAGNPLLVGDLVYTITGNGVDEGHVNIPAPRAPSFIAVEKKTGKLVWEDASPGGKILHGSWSNPSYAVLGGKPQVVFPGGNGWLYSFEPQTGKLIWSFDMNPKDSVYELGGRGTKSYVIAMAAIHDGVIYIGVGQDPEHGEGPGNFWAVAPGDKTGDLTGKAVLWHAGGPGFGRTLSTAAIQDGLVYAADLSGFVRCFDAKTGQKHWEYDTFAAIWGSPFYADGKVYIGDEDGDIAVLRAGKKLEVLHEVNMGAAVYTTPVAKDGVMYIMTRDKLFAVQEGIAPKAPAQPAAKAPKKAEG
jgi:outer membrane protein assembly factor BamB